jgi:glycosyltransferase involved in cell wall biosynthesis
MGWGGVADVVVRILARRGIEARTVLSMYSTVEHEQGAKASGRLVQETARLRLRYELLAAWTRGVAAPLEGRGYRASDVVLVHYENVGRLVVGAYGPHPKILNVPYCAPAALAGDIGPGVDYARADGEPPLIVSVSRHSPRKGLDILLRALAELRDRGVVFRACLVGPGRLLSEHRALATRLGLDEIVSIPGGVQHPLEYLRACEVYVLPSTEEGSGSVSVLEALQVAAPIVASAIDGIPEDLTDEQDALLVAPGSVGELADALGRMLADAPLRERLGRAGRALYERRFTASRTAEELGRVYTALGLPPRNPAAQARS